MSDLLVKGLKAPTGCKHGECVFACSAAYNTGLICVVKQEYVIPGEIPYDCPCSVIQPHGRLIDADDLLLQVAEIVEEYTDHELSGYSKEQIENAKTIIKASEG